MWEGSRAKEWCQTPGAEKDKLIILLHRIHSPEDPWILTMQCYILDI